LSPSDPRDPTKNTATYYDMHRKYKTKKKTKSAVSDNGEIIVLIESSNNEEIK